MTTRSRPATAAHPDTPPPPGWEEHVALRKEIDEAVERDGSYGIPLEDFISAIEARIGTARG